MPMVKKVDIFISWWEKLFKPWTPQAQKSFSLMEIVDYAMAYCDGLKTKKGVLFFNSYPFSI